MCAALGGSLDTWAVAPKMLIVKMACSRCSERGPSNAVVMCSPLLLQGEIRATAFNEQVDKFFPLIEVNKVRQCGV